MQGKKTPGTIRVRQLESGGQEISKPGNKLSKEVFMDKYVFLSSEIIHLKHNVSLTLEDDTTPSIYTLKPKGNNFFSCSFP